MTSIIDLIDRYLVANRITRNRLAVMLDMPASAMYSMMAGNKFPTVQQRITMRKIGLATADQLLEAELLYKESLARPILAAARTATAALAIFLIATGLMMTPEISHANSRVQMGPHPPTSASAIDRDGLAPPLKAPGWSASSKRRPGRPIRQSCRSEPA